MVKRGAVVIDVGFNREKMERLLVMSILIQRLNKPD